jgi:hypothetical protein
MWDTSRRAFGFTGKQQVCMKPKETTMVQRAVARIVILLLSLLAVPLVAHPQAPRKIHRIGYLRLGPAPSEAE